MKYLVVELIESDKNTKGKYKLLAIEYNKETKAMLLGLAYSGPILDYTLKGYILPLNELNNLKVKELRGWPSMSICEGVLTGQPSEWKAEVMSKEDWEGEVISLTNVNNPQVFGMIEITSGAERHLSDNRLVILSGR